MNTTIDISQELQGEMAVEAMTKRSIAKIAEKKQLLKVKREMFKNRFENDALWREAEQAYKDARLKRSQEKLRIMEEPAMKSLEAQIDELQREVKDEQLALSDWLYQYQTNTGASTIETEEGKVYLVQRKYSVKKESKAAKWLRTHAEKKSLQPLPGISPGVVA